MIKKDEKKKVGRPKLADSKTKKESIIVCLFITVIIIIVAIIEINTIMIDFNFKYAKATVYNNHINSCIIKNNEIDCGPEVTYMKYKVDNNKYVEIFKQNKSIKVKLKNYKNINVCYKTNKIDLRCNK